MEHKLKGYDRKCKNFELQSISTIISLKFKQIGDPRMKLT